MTKFITRSGIRNLCFYLNFYVLFAFPIFYQMFPGKKLDNLVRFVIFHYFRLFKSVNT